MQYRLLLSLLAVAGLAGTAAAASGTVSASLSPNKVSKPSGLTITATGPFSSSGLPKSVDIKVQKGFRSSPKSVRVLCTAAQASKNTCPKKSHIGSGTAKVTATFLGSTYHPTVALSLFLGKPQRKGDISSVVITGTLENSPYGNGTTSSSTGRLFKRAGGGLELLFANLPNYTLPPGVTVTLDSLQIKAKAIRTVKKGKRHHKHKVRYSLITNPAACNGTWTGSFTVTFSSGSQSSTLSSPCRR